MSDRILVATRKGLFQLRRKSAAGRVHWDITHADFLGDHLTMALPDPRDGTFYTALYHGHFGCKMHRSRDGGATWSECGTPSYPPQPENWNPPPTAAGSQAAPWNLQLIWCLETGGRDEPGVVWMGTIPGGLFRSADGGDTWQFNRPLWDMPERLQWFGGGYDHAGIDSICVDPRDSKHVTLAVSCGGVWETRDGGGSWRGDSRGMYAEFMPPERREDPNIQDPHRMVHCPSKPDTFWIQHHNGVFRSTDGARQWHEINPPVSKFGFAAAVHPRDADTAWLVPAIKDEKRIPVDARVVVTRTRDGGRTFDVLTDGLPQSHAYDLTFRHALDVDASGDRLVFGSTTGSLWVSENQGDSWQCVSNHLPPVYCTRFVP